MTLSGGGALNGSSGAVAIAASGTNQNITLTPSGTGTVVIPSGNLGIGTSTPGQMLSLQGSSPFVSIYNTATTGAGLYLTASSGGDVYYARANGAGGIVNGSVQGEGVIRTNAKRLLFTTTNGSTIQMMLSAAGGLSVGNTTDAGAGGISASGTLSVTGITTATGGIVLGTKTVGTLPTASSNTYLSFIITDALAPALGVTVSAGGSAKAAVRSNGTNWIVTEVL
jgi:hypothetical protein